MTLILHFVKHILTTKMLTNATYKNTLLNIYVLCSALNFLHDYLIKIFFFGIRIFIPCLWMF
jgi:hypothetical protein